MINIYSISLKLRKIYIDDKQIYSENYPQPSNLAGLLEKCGYTITSELKGWISPDYEKLIMKNIYDYFLVEYGRTKTWKGKPLDYLCDKELFENEQNKIYDKENLIPLGKTNKKELTETISKFLLSKKNNIDFKDYEILTWGLENLKLNFPDKIHNKQIIRMALDRGVGATSVASVNDILETITWPNKPGSKKLNSFWIRKES